MLSEIMNTQNPGKLKKQNRYHYFTALKAKEYDHDFVISDNNQRCIGFIADYWRATGEKVRTWI